MKTTLRITTGLMFFVSSFLSAQNAAHKPSTLPAVTRTTTVLTQPQAESSNPSVDPQMVICTDKITYCDRHPQTNQDWYLGGQMGWSILFQTFDGYSGPVSEAYASLRRVGANCPVKICIWALDANGDPSGGYLAFVDATVTSSTATEYGGLLSTTPNVTNGFAIGVFVTNLSTTDSAFMMTHNDPEMTGNAYEYYDPTTAMYNAQTDFSDDIDFLFRPKISYTAPTQIATASPTSGCAGTPINFYSSQSGTPSFYSEPWAPTGTVSYSWGFGDAGTSTSAAPSHPYASAGTYTASVTVTNPGWTTSCPSAAATTTVTITGTTPSVSIAGSASVVCPTTTVNFSATPTNGGSSPTYTWKKNSVIVGSGISYAGSTWAGGDVVTCEMISNAACAPTSPVISNSIIMYMQPLSFSSYNYVATGLSVSFTSTAANAVSWAWNFGDAGTSASATPVHNYAAPGTYTVDLTVTNACGQTTVSSINITVSSSGNSSGGNTGLNEKDLQINVNVFPNPVNDNLNIQYSLNHPTDATIEVFNMLGEVVSAQVIKSGSTGTAKVAMENLSGGLYFVRFTAADKTQMMRVIHQ